MSRPRLAYGVFRLKPDTTPLVTDGDAIEKYTDLKKALIGLSDQRAAESSAGGNCFDIVLLPLGQKGEGLLCPGT